MPRIAAPPGTGGRRSCRSEHVANLVVATTAGVVELRERNGILDVLLEHHDRSVTVSVFKDTRMNWPAMEEPLRPDEECLTASEVARRLKLNEETVRRIFLNEPGVIVIYRPRKGRRQYRTLRIPEHV